MWLIFLLLSTAFADFDLSLGGTTRSYPLSGVVEAEAGYGVLVWGDTSSPFYGYTRAAISGASSITYNSGQAMIELFPVSILGARAGYESIQNSADYTAYECEIYQCKGGFARRFVEGELTVGAGPVFLQGRARREQWSRSQDKNGPKDFIDPTSGLALNESNKTENVYTAIAGFKINDHWQLLGGLRYAVDEKDHTSRFPFAAVGYRYNSLTLRLGAGSFESELKVQKLSALATINWEVLPSLAIK